MKELTEKEKAQRYDEAIKYAYYLINERCKEGIDGSFHRADLQKMFPELKESEDERIRKVITDIVKAQPSDSLFNGTKEKCLAWLENQNLVIEMKTPEESLGVDLDTYNKIVDECVYGEPKSEVDQHSLPVSDNSSLPTFDESIYHPCTEKEHEQKPADKIEPKFKVGQTIIYKGTENIAPTKMTISDIAKGQYWDDNCCIAPISDQDNWELVEQKPTDEQIEALSHMIDAVEDEWVCEEPIGRELLKQLKKLRGE